MELSRRGKDTEGAGPTPTWIKIREGYLRTRSPRPTPGPLSSGFQCQEDKSPQFLVAKPVGTESVEEAAGALNSFSWGTHTRTHLLRLTPSGLQYLGGSMKGTSCIQGDIEVSGIGGKQRPLYLC